MECSTNLGSLGGSSPFSIPPSSTRPPHQHTNNHPPLFPLVICTAQGAKLNARGCHQPTDPP